MRLCKPLFAFLLAVQAAGAQIPEGRSATPWAVVVDTTTHTFYVVDTDGDAVLQVNAATRNSKRIPVGRRPIALALDASENRLYVVNAGSGDVSVVNTATQQVVATRKTDSHPYAIAVDTASHKVYISNTFSNQLTVLDENNGTVTALPLGSKDALLCDPARHRVYMTSYEDTSVAMLDETTATVTRLPAVTHLWSMALEPRSGLLSVTSVGEGELLRLSPEQPQTSVKTGKFPSAVALDGETAVVSNYGDGTVSILSGKKVRTVRVGGAPQAVTVDALHHTAYVADAHRNIVTSIDVAHARVLNVRPAGPRPYAIAVDPQTHMVMVANLDTSGKSIYTLLAPSM